MSMTRVQSIVNGLVDDILTVSEFIKTAEKKIYNPDEVERLDSESLLSMYNSASTRQLKVLEMCRKMLMASKGTDTYSEEVMAMAALLGNLSKENLDQLKGFIKTSIAN